MSAGRYDIVIEKGANFRPVFVWSTKDASGNKVPVNLTGYTARSHLRGKLGDASPALDMTPYITLGTTGGDINYNVPAANTTALTIKSGVWDLELVSPTGVVTRLLEGNAKIKEEVTRT